MSETQSLTQECFYGLNFFMKVKENEKVVCWRSLYFAFLTLISCGVSQELIILAVFFIRFFFLSFFHFFHFLISERMAIFAAAMDQLLTLKMHCAAFESRIEFYLYSQFRIILRQYYFGKLLQIKIRVCCLFFLSFHRLIAVF